MEVLVQIDARDLLQDVDDGMGVAIRIGESDIYYDTTGEKWNSIHLCYL